ncbi:MAG: trypsin-like peptidase domain-containing protein [Chloroflexi bacterium]|nr:trypsin-like peptidase domain-containing protein [Chloroflexota bacterium]
MTNALTNVSNDLAALVAAVSSGVVRVEGRRRMAASGIVWSADGLIVTTHHVLEQDEGIQVGLADGRSVAATLVGRDPTTDLALLRAQAAGLTPLPWAEADTARVGHLVLALGRPGPSILATLGVVSALGEAWRTPLGGAMDRLIQTDAAMFPGFSGGPLVDASGRVLGPNTTAILRGLSLTIPAGTVRRVVETLLAHGRVRRGYLGIGAQPVRLPQPLAAQLGQNTGLLLVSVETGSPGAQAGLVMGDTIVALEGQPVRRLEDLLGQLNAERIGQAVALRIIRGGQVQERSVTVGSRDS